MVHFIHHWAGRTELPLRRLLRWLGVARSQFDRWRRRAGTPNRHNGRIPRDFWLEDWEKQAIIGFHFKNPLEGYRRLTFMMLDADIVAVSPTSAGRNPRSDPANRAGPRFRSEFPNVFF